VRLFRNGVLIGEDSVSGVALVVLLHAILAAGGRFMVLVGKLLEGLGVSRVDCWNHRKVVLEFLEVVVASRDSVVQRVD